MIHCYTCGKVFREEQYKEYNRHDNVAHLHDYKYAGVKNY